MPHHDRAPLTWSEDDGTSRLGLWLSADDRRPPSTIRVVGDGLGAARALALASEGAGLLWRGDYHQARHLLDAMRRRLPLPPPRRPLPIAAEFHRRRQHRARTARLSAAVLVELEPGGEPALRRAPEAAAAVGEVHGEIDRPALITLRELLGVLNVHRLRRDGIPVAALDGERIHPHYGVFAPTRQDYVDLAARALRPTRAGHPPASAFDIGTGTGVLAAVLVRRGVEHVLATDDHPRAVACARDNLERLGLGHSVEVAQRDLFPAGRAELVVANPPWLPGTPAAAAESGVYDRRGTMTDRFVLGVGEHLRPGGEAWLIQSTLAEHLGLRRPGHLDTLVERAGLKVHDVLETAPAPSRHPTTLGQDDPVEHARRQERIQLWRLADRLTSG